MTSLLLWLGFVKCSLYLTILCIVWYRIHCEPEHLSISLGHMQLAPVCVVVNYSGIMWMDICTKP